MTIQRLRFRSAALTAEERTPLDSIDRAIADIAAGKAVIVIDAEDRENEGDLVFAAELATPELMGFVIRHSSGYVCVPMTGAAADRLGLPLMVESNNDPMCTAFTVTVDARQSVSTGISAGDRATTCRVLADPATSQDALTRPGHINPLRARDGGVLTRPGHTEAAVDLCRLAGLQPVGVISEIVSRSDPRQMARGGELREFSREHGLTVISIADLIAWRERHEPSVQRRAEARLPTVHGDFRAVGYKSSANDHEHLALVLGEVSDGREVLVRVHSECLTGDVFGSRRCDCGTQLELALAAVGQAGRGVVVYLRGHEGRGIGLLQKLQAYALQEGGADTVDANLQLGLPTDSRSYREAAHVLEDLGISRVRLLTNNPAKASGLAGHAFEITECVALPSHVTSDNLRYLTTKRDRMGHDLHVLQDGHERPALLCAGGGLLGW